MSASRTSCTTLSFELSHSGPFANLAVTPHSSKKFPGYTSENLSSKGVHEVSARRFVLVSADHPIVSAISENGLCFLYPSNAYPMNAHVLIFAHVRVRSGQIADGRDLHDARGPREDQLRLV